MQCQGFKWGQLHAKCLNLCTNSPVLVIQLCNDYKLLKNTFNVSTSTSLYTRTDFAHRKHMIPDVSYTLSLYCPPHSAVKLLSTEPRTMPGNLLLNEQKNIYYILSWGGFNCLKNDLHSLSQSYPCQIIIPTHPHLSNPTALHVRI